MQATCPDDTAGLLVGERAKRDHRTIALDEALAGMRAGAWREDGMWRLPEMFGLQATGTHVYRWAKDIEAQQPWTTIRPAAHSDFQAAEAAEIGTALEQALDSDRLAFTVRTDWPLTASEVAVTYDGHDCGHHHHSRIGPSAAAPN